MSVFERVLSVLTNVWLALWSEGHWHLSQGAYLSGYSAIGIGQAVVSW